MLHVNILENFYKGWNSIIISQGDKGSNQKDNFLSILLGFFHTFMFGFFCLFLIKEKKKTWPSNILNKEDKICLMPGPNSISVPLGITTMVSFPRDNNDISFHVKIWDKCNIVVATWLFPRREWYSLGSHVHRESVEWIRACFSLRHLKLFSNSWRKEVFLPEACSIGEKTAPGESIFHEWIPTSHINLTADCSFSQPSKKNCKGKFLISRSFILCKAIS